MAIPRTSAPPLYLLHRPVLAASPAPAPPQMAAALVDASQKRGAALAANDIRLGTIVDRLEAHFRGQLLLSPSELFYLVFQLARGIDYAVSDNYIPPHAHRLPSIIKQVEHHYLHLGCVCILAPSSMVSVVVPTVTQPVVITKGPRALFPLVFSIFNCVCIAVDIAFVTQPPAKMSF
ncbi:hypothetical protein Cni_G09498 [Canna indica]|uniref:Uncharacterized protein n=1 Tax=Canna indica TaxID=4628 RepID=A0AAQ3K4F0_9LILI|nr:hypothetical protein Cni_G09498 [Canna indica]